MEDMNYIFGVETRQHVDYQIKKVAPWCVDYYLRRQKDAVVDPLYRTVQGGNRYNEEADGKAMEDQMNDGRTQAKKGTVGAEGGVIKWVWDEVRTKRREKQSRSKMNRSIMNE